MKFAWQIANGMSYLSSIPVSDVIILWGTSLQNKASFVTQYTSLSVELWTGCQGCHPMSLSHPQASRFVKGCFPKETFSLCLRLFIENVLVGEGETCKVTDFGMARDVQEDKIYEKKLEDEKLYDNIVLLLFHDGFYRTYLCCFLFELLVGLKIKPSVLVEPA